MTLWLQANPNSNALFVTHENITTGFYPGKKPEMLVANVLFGMGAAAVLLSNKSAMARVAKYQLVHSERVHVGADTVAYRSMGMFEGDGDGYNHSRFSPDVPTAAQGAVKAAITKVGVQRRGAA